MGTVAPFQRALTAPPESEPPVTALDAAGLLALLDLALTRISGSQKAAAIDLGVSAGQLSKWLHGKERFGLVDLARHVGIQREFARLLALACGLDVRSLTAQQRRRKRIEELRRELFVLQDEEMRETA